MVEAVASGFKRKFTSQAFWKQVFTHGEASRIIILVALIGVMAVASNGLTFSLKNTWNILSASSIVGIATIGQFFAMRAGGIDLSVRDLSVLAMGVGGVLMSGTISTAAIVTREAIPIPLGILLIFSITIGWGAAGGMMWTRGGIPALVVGLALWRVAMGANVGFIGGRTVLGLPRELAFLGQGTIGGQVPAPFLIFLIVASVTYFILYHTSFGRAIHAVGGNGVNAYLSGIDVKNVRLKAYIALGTLTGLASTVFLSRSMSVSTRSIPGLHFDTISAVFIGGMTIGGAGGTLVGAMVGVMILGVISNAMSLLGLPNELFYIIKGSILIAAVAFAYMRSPRE